MQWSREWTKYSTVSNTPRTLFYACLKLKFRQYPVMHTNRMLYHCTTLNIIIIFDTVVMQKRNCKHKNDEFISIAILRLLQHHQGFCAVRLHTSTVGNVKITRSERLYYCYIHMTTFRIVWLLRNLSLGGKLCLRDDKNTAFV